MVSTLILLVVGVYVGIFLGLGRVCPGFLFTPVPLQQTFSLTTVSEKAKLEEEKG